MSPSFQRRTFSAFLLTIALALPSAEAAPRRAAESRSLTAVLWSLVSAAREKAGCIIDPNGVAGPACTTPPATTEEGCILDPDGSCVASPGTPV
ncbi:MAG TPA: hypothetical protein VMW27_01540 [Thermoanaerobaculia bacterium]|nr:hypothetical protein [Thermoanaerobaculia bacterium]